MKVGEDGLVPRTGAEFMALETTAEAGTCLAWRSMLGLVGSSARAEGAVGEGPRNLNLPATLGPSLTSRLGPHPQTPKALQGPPGNTPTAKGTHPPLQSRKLGFCLLHHTEGTRGGQVTPLRPGS